MATARKCFFSYAKQCDFTSSARHASYSCNSERRCQYDRRLRLLFDGKASSVTDLNIRQYSQSSPVCLAGRLSAYLTDCLPTASFTSECTRGPKCEHAARPLNVRRGRRRRPCLACALGYCLTFQSMMEVVHDDDDDDQVRVGIGTYVRTYVVVCLSAFTRERASCTTTEASRRARLR